MPEGAHQPRRTPASGPAAARRGLLVAHRGVPVTEHGAVAGHRRSPHAGPQGARSRHPGAEAAGYGPPTQGGWADAVAPERPRLRGRLAGPARAGRGRTREGVIEDVRRPPRSVRSRGGLPPCSRCTPRTATSCTSLPLAALQPSARDRLRRRLRGPDALPARGRGARCARRGPPELPLSVRISASRLGRRAAGRSDELDRARAAHEGRWASISSTAARRATPGQRASPLGPGVPGAVRLAIRRAGRHHYRRGRTDHQAAGGDLARGRRRRDPARPQLLATRPDPCVPLSSWESRATTGPRSTCARGHA